MSVWAILIGMIVFNQVMMCWAQKFVSPTRAVLIYTLEPVFAGIIGYAIGEPFTKARSSVPSWWC